MYDLIGLAHGMMYGDKASNCTSSAYYTGADLGGQGGQCSLQNFSIYVTFTLSNMEIYSGLFNHLLNLQNYAYSSYYIDRWSFQWHTIYVFKCHDQQHHTVITMYITLKEITVNFSNCITTNLMT